jgi:hypothetical protein
LSASVCSGATAGEAIAAVSGGELMFGIAAVAAEEV